MAPTVIILSLPSDLSLQIPDSTFTCGSNKLLQLCEWVFKVNVANIILVVIIEVNQL